MVYLKSYECHSCQSLCEVYRRIPVGICVVCGYLKCGKCRAFEETKKCRISGKECDFVSYCTFFLNYVTQFAPKEELKLLNFGKWSPLFGSSSCKHSITSTNKLSCVDNTQSRFCEKCLPVERIPRQPNVDTYMKIINELSGHFSPVKSDIIVRKGIQLESLNCNICKETIDWYEKRYMSGTGLLHCSKCKFQLVPISMKLVASYFSFLWYIPDTEDLKLLTYSKWTPLRCTECSTVFSEEYKHLPMFHPDCRQFVCNQCSGNHRCEYIQGKNVDDDEKKQTGKSSSPVSLAKFLVSIAGKAVEDVGKKYVCKAASPAILAKFLVDVIQEFRPLFKSGGVQESCSEEKVAEQLNMVNEKQSLSRSVCANMEREGKKIRLATLDDGLPGASVIPNEISCLSCSLFSNVTELRNCLNCEMYGICAACLMKDHWGHEIKETEEGMMKVILQNDAESNLAKLAKWNGYLKSIHTQGIAEREELCDSYKYAYEKAITSKDPGLVQAIRQENISQMQERVEDFITAHVKFNEDVHALAGRLRRLRKND